MCCTCLSCRYSSKSANSTHWTPRAPIRIKQSLFPSTSKSTQRSARSTQHVALTVEVMIFNLWFEHRKQLHRHTHTSARAHTSAHTTHLSTHNTPQRAVWADGMGRWAAAVRWCTGSRRVWRAGGWLGTRYWTSPLSMYCCSTRPYSPSLSVSPIEVTPSAA